MATPPTVISYTQALAAGLTSWEAQATTISTAAAVSWQTGDVIVVVGAQEAGNGVNPILAPTATGLVFTQQVAKLDSSAVCAAGIWTAVAASTSSAVVTQNCNSSADNRGLGVWVWRGSSGVGNSAIQFTAVTTMAFTPTAANSGICWGAFDWDAGAPAGFTITPTPTNQREKAGHLAGIDYTVYVADIPNQTSAGAVSYGITGAGGADCTIVIVEIKGSAGVTTRPLSFGLNVGFDGGINTGEVAYGAGGDA